ncbi:MAG: LPS-assembly protein LptD [Woeseiaceae bacterium]
MTPLWSVTGKADDELPSVLCENTGFSAPETDALPIENEAFNLESGSGSITLGGDAILKDGVRASGGGYAIEASEGRYEQAAGALSLLGDIRYTGMGADIASQTALLDYLYGKVEFSDAEFRLGNGASRGAAGLLRLNRRGKIRLEDVSYTSCPEGKDDWIVQARKIRLDTENGVGEANGLSLRFKGIPVLYAPYLSFPISAQRKTGFLLPRIGQSTRNGVDIAAPWYWNIAPAFDATFTPRILSRRGVQLGTEFRYLTKRSTGTMQAVYLPGDDLTGLDRTLFEWQNQTDFASRWRAFIDVTDVSDNAYLEDLGGSLSSAAATHLNRSVGLRYLGTRTTAEARLTHYQTIDQLIGPADVPYRLLPAVRVDSRYPDLPLGIELGLNAELTGFDRDVGVTGARYHVAPSISLPIENSGFYLEPRLQWMYTHYKLDEDSTTGDTSLTRSMPIAEFRTGIRLERELSDGNLRQTLEPHLYYVHVPFRDQNDIPVFDTIQPIASIEQLYRNNRFVGLDRIGDTDQVTVGVTTRLINSDDGKAILTATLGQSRYLSSQTVALPGLTDTTGNSSDYIAELRLAVWGNWNIDVAQQWNSESNRTTKSEIRLQYLPGRNRVVNIGYRFRRDSIDQGDISWSWPISSRWNAVGRYNYSFREETTLERFVGFEYQSCCWGLSIVSRRFISRRDGTSDSAIAIQLELKGLSSVGDPVNQLLERGILGYGNR